RLRKSVALGQATAWNKAPPLAVSANGQWLAVTDREGQIDLFEVCTGQRAFTLKADRWPADCLAFSPDGRMLVSAVRDNVLKVWDLPTRQELASIGGHRGWIVSAAFSPSGDLLATGGSESTVLLWNVAGLSAKVRKPAQLSAGDLTALWKDLG